MHGGVVLVDHNGASAGLVRVPLPRVQTDTLAHAGVPILRRDAHGSVRSYSRALIVLEAVFAALAGGSVLLTRPGPVDLSSSLFWAAAGLVVMWPTLLVAVGAHAPRLFGTGSDEYRLVG